MKKKSVFLNCSIWLVCAQGHAASGKERIAGLELQEASCEMSRSGMDLPFCSRDHVWVQSLKIKTYKQNKYLQFLSWLLCKTFSCVCQLYMQVLGISSVSQIDKLKWFLMKHTCQGRHCVQDEPTQRRLCACTGASKTKETSVPKKQDSLYHCHLQLHYAIEKQ